MPGWSWVARGVDAAPPVKGTPAASASRPPPRRFESRPAVTPAGSTPAEASRLHRGVLNSASAGSGVHAGGVVCAGVELGGAGFRHRTAAPAPRLHRAAAAPAPPLLRRGAAASRHARRSASRPAPPRRSESRPAVTPAGSAPAEAGRLHRGVLNDADIPLGSCRAIVGNVHSVPRMRLLHWGVSRSGRVPGRRSHFPGSRRWWSARCTRCGSGGQRSVDSVGGQRVPTRSSAGASALARATRPSQPRLFLGCRAKVWRSHAIRPKVGR